MPDDAPTPEEVQRADESPEPARSEVSGEEIGLMAAEAAVGQVSAMEEAPSRAMEPLRSVPAGLWPDIPGVFFPEPYALDFEWQQGVPEAAVRAREQVQPGLAAGAPASGDNGAEDFERTEIDLETGDLEMVDDEEFYEEEAEPTIEMEVEVEEVDLDAESGEAPAPVETAPPRRPPDSIQPIDDAEIEEILEMRDAALEHEVPAGAASARPAPPPTPPKQVAPRAERADPARAVAQRRKPSPRAAPPLPPDATGQQPTMPEPGRTGQGRRAEEGPADEARVMPLDKVRSFRKLQGPRPTMSQPNLIEAALSGGDPTAASTAALSGKARPWYEAIFDESFFNFLPKNLHRQTRREAKFAHDSLRLADGARVLDVACGFGRHSLELAKRGLQMTGLDLSETLVAKARDEAARRKVDLEFTRGDMRELAYDREFDGALLIGHSFGYFDDQTNLEVLEGIHAALRPRGRLLLQMLNRDKVIRELPEVIWWRGLDCLVLEEIEFDPETSRMQSKRTVVFDDGRPPWEQFIEIRLYSLHEIYTILEEVGFRVADVSGSFHYRGAFFLNESRDLLILTERERELI